MHPRDPHRYSHELDEVVVQRLIARLESRACSPVFLRPLQAYLNRLGLTPETRILEIGCGTGAISRIVAEHRAGQLGEGSMQPILGVDQSPAFIAAARQFAAQSLYASQLQFEVADAHGLPHDDAEFDVIVAHTLLSHVADPKKVLQELSRVLKPGGTLVVFDGDYASLSYAYEFAEFGREMDQALASATFNNPLFVRQLPLWLDEVDLQRRDAWGEALIEIGNADYFKTFAQTYVPAVIDAQLVDEGAALRWLEYQLLADATDVFFASCNYYTFFLNRQ
jgi:SAM-dependent methyltransferase